MTPKTDGRSRGKNGPRLYSKIDQYVGDKWDRQDMETPTAYSHFLCYRDLGPTRTIAQVAAAKGRSGAHFRELSVEFNWRERAAAWDDYLASVAREEAVAARREMAKRHIDLGTKMQTLACKALDQLSDEDLGRLARAKLGDIVRMLEGGVKTEREARGIDTEEGTEEGGAAIAAVRLTRRMLLNPEAQALSFAAFDLISEQGDREPILDAMTGEPLELEPASTE